jgi:hypothetical protein
LLALKTNMSESRTCERVDYLWRLENVYLEAARCVPVAIDLLGDGDVSLSTTGGLWILTGWTVFVLFGAVFRSPLGDAGDTAGSLLPEMLFQQPAFW